MAEAIGPVLADAIHVQTRHSRDALVESVGPILGDAIQVQLRDSRQELVEGLYPVIGEIAQRFIVESLRELQRTIDARLRSTFGPAGSLQRLIVRLRGISPADLALRESLPFTVQELFLIQPGSGLLMAHVGESAVDSDQIGGMLTAIRHFIADSFGQSETYDELDEIQHGGRRIIVQNGRYAYLAVVLRGIESTGFRSHLWRFVTRLHARYAPLLQTFNGDPDNLVQVQREVELLAAGLAQISREIAGETPPRHLNRSQKLLLGGGVVSLLMVAGTACFLSYFVWSAWPVVFATATPTATATLPPTPLPTPTTTATTTSSPSATHSPTPSATSSPTPLPTATPTTTPTMSPTPQLEAVRTNSPVWARSDPESIDTIFAPIPANTEVMVIAMFESWIEVIWTGPTGTRRGWIHSQWVDNLDSVTAEIVTSGAATPDTDSEQP
jgi:hypothetical protein